MADSTASPSSPWKGYNAELIRLLKADKGSFSFVQWFEKIEVFSDQSGQARIWTVRDLQLNRDVLLKEIRQCDIASREKQTRLRYEAEITGGMKHPNIVPILAQGQFEDGRFFFLMPRVEGHDFDEEVRRYHRITHRRAADKALRELLRHFVAVCRAVAYMHSRGILHCDLKPSNIRLDSLYERIFVLDLGMAKYFEPAADLRNKEGLLRGSSDAMRGKVGGTPPWMSPEQALYALRRGIPIDPAVSYEDLEEAVPSPDHLLPAADIYSLGALLYFILRCKEPFQTHDKQQRLCDEDLVARILAGKLQWTQATQHPIPPALEAICRNAMMRMPQDRYQTVNELADAVDNWLSDRQVRVERELNGKQIAIYRDPFWVRGGRWLRQHPKWASGIAVTLVMVMVSLGVAWYLSAKAYQNESTFQQTLTVAYQGSLIFHGGNEELDDYGAKLIDLEKRIAAYHNKIEYWRTLARCYNNLAILCQFQGQNTMAKNYHSRAREIREKLCKDDRRNENPEFQLDLAASLNHLSVLDHSLDFASRAVDILKQQAAPEGPKAPNARRYLAIAYNNRGALHLDRNDFVAARGDFNEAVRIWDKLLGKKPGNLELQRNRCKSLGGLGLASANLEDSRAAGLDHCRQAREAAQKMANEHPSDPSFQRDLAHSARFLGDCCLAIVHEMEEEDPKALALLNEARSSYEKALVLWQEPFPRSPQETRDFLFRTHAGLAQALARAHVPDKSIRALDKAMELAVPERRPEFQAHRVRLLVFINPQQAALDGDKLRPVVLQSYSGQASYSLACAYALLSEKVGGDQRKVYIDHAVSLLDQARQKGFFESVSHFRYLKTKDRDLASIRMDPGFRDLVKGIEGNP
jgi:serine/threonine protein kinase/tetratricopeptide (TPR) repeat protein